ncbi:hypothetical protein [Erwinia phage vB_Ea277G]|jgi:hypothetical protein|nr:hypothetical protein [Erwinia phage vB_Ea277G]
MSKNNADKVQDLLRTSSDLSNQVAETQQQQDGEQTVHDTQVAAEVAVETTEASVGAAVETQRPVADANSAFTQYDEVSGLAKSLVLQWDKYVKDANPANRQTVSSLKSLQESLVNLVLTTFNLESDEDFVVVMGRLMGLVRENPNRVFGAEAIFRGFSHLNLSDKRINAIRFAIDCVLTFADPKGRKNALQYYNLQQSASVCRTTAARERLIGYITRISE